MYSLEGIAVAFAD